MRSTREHTPSNRKEEKTAPADLGRNEVHRNRDVEDRRESSRPVRPGSGGTQGARLPRGGTR